MPAVARRITKTVFVVLNIIASFIFLAACFAPLLDPIQWWFISLLGLGFAFVVITLVAFMAFWLIFKRRYILISLVPLLIGYKSIATFFAFNTTQKFNYEKAPGSIRVAQWNLARFIEWKRNNSKGSQTRLKMIDQIKEQAPDVLCVQEFFTSTDSTYYNNLNVLMNELGYTHFFYAWTGDGDLQWFGNAIFSKYPIVDSGKVRFPYAKYPETVLHADVKVGADTIRFYTTHLQSLDFKKADFDNIEEIKEEQKDILQNAKGLFGKVRRAMMLRKGQAEIIREMISNDPYPTILTGDFNDVPNSYAYATIKGSMFQDVFLEKGFGIGRTFNDISPTLRIDYLFATKDFELLQFNRVARNLSDHYMLVADIKLKPPTP